MFFPEQQVRVFLYGVPVDMRRSFDGLYAIARHSMPVDPLGGHLFAFINRRATQIKVLYSIAAAGAFGPSGSSKAVFWPTGTGWIRVRLMSRN